MRQSPFERILGIVCSVLDAYSAVLFLAEDAAGDAGGIPAECRLAAVFSLGDKVRLSATVQPGKGLEGWILRHGEPLLVPNFDQRQNQLGYYRDNEEQRIKAFMGCALPGNRGVVCVDSKRQYSFSEKDQKMLHLFAELLAELATQLGQARAQTDALGYYAALKTVYTLRRRHSRWNDFLGQFLALMVATTDFTYAAFCSTDYAGEKYTLEGESSPLLAKGKGKGMLFPVQNGVIGWVFRNGAPLYNDGGEGLPEAFLFGKDAGMAQFQTVMAAPLLIQRKTLGVLCLASDVPFALCEETRNFALMASEHLALFLENLYIKGRLRDAYQNMVPKGAAE
jgi:signal transduction protein with GAF and PtsI domain